MLRQEEGISQEKLGEILNLGKSAVFSYEKQGRQPNFRTLIAMSAHFGVSIDYLLGVTDIRDRYTEEEAALLQMPLDELSSNTGTVCRIRKSSVCTPFSASCPI